MIIINIIRLVKRNNVNIVELMVVKLYVLTYELRGSFVLLEKKLNDLF